LPEGHFLRYDDLCVVSGLLMTGGSFIRQRKEKG